ncbi:MAG: hypothetical protein WBB01_05750 [Phormidesmis sp.]
MGDSRFMNAAKSLVTPSVSARQPSATIASNSVSTFPTKPKRAYRSTRTPHAGARRAIAFESSVKLTVNLLLATVATTTIAKLVPYYQTQQQELDTLQATLQVAEQENAELRSQFNRNFDPAQAAQIMQEQSGLAYPNQKRIVWGLPSESPE